MFPQCTGPPVGVGEGGRYLFDLLSDTHHDSQEAGVSYRWDGLPLRRTPAVATLPTSLRESIAAATRLDRSLYMRAVSEP